MKEQLDGHAIVEVERLVAAAHGKVLTLAGKDYTTVPLHLLPRRAEPDPGVLGTSSLQSVVDYVRGMPDVSFIAPRTLFIHVASPREVHVRTGAFGETSQRGHLLAAELPLASFAFGTWHDPESFSIGLLSMMAPTADRERVLQLTGTIRSDAVQTVTSDGVTQQVTAARGVVLASKQEVPHLVTLKPFRAFLEIEQVESPFLLRVRGGGDGKLPVIALFEADGRRWKTEAVERVKRWLADALLGVGIYG